MLWCRGRGTSESNVQVSSLKSGLSRRSSKSEGGRAMVERLSPFLFLRGPQRHEGSKKNNKTINAEHQPSRAGSFRAPAWRAQSPQRFAQIRPSIRLPRSTMVGSAKTVSMDVETSEAIERLGDRINGLERSLRGEFREGLAENRRHAEIFFKSLRDDIRLVAEGVAVLSAKIDRM